MRTFTWRHWCHDNIIEKIFAWKYKTQACKWKTFPLLSLVFTERFIYEWSRQIDKHILHEFISSVSNFVAVSSLSLFLGWSSKVVAIVYICIVYSTCKCAVVLLCCLFWNLFSCRASQHLWQTTCTNWSWRRDRWRRARTLWWRRSPSSVPKVWHGFQDIRWGYIVLCD